MLSDRAANQFYFALSRLLPFIVLCGNTILPLASCIETERTVTAICHELLTSGLDAKFFSIFIHAMNNK